MVRRSLEGALTLPGSPHFGLSQLEAGWAHGLRDVLNTPLQGDGGRQLWSLPKPRFKLWRLNKKGKPAQGVH